MLKFAVNDNSPEAMEYRRDLINEKKEDILRRFNEELRQGPLNTYLRFDQIHTKTNGWSQNWDVYFTRNEDCEFVVKIHSLEYKVFYNRIPTRNFRSKNRIHAYFHYLSHMAIKYAEELNDLRKQITFG